MTNFRTKRAAYTFVASPTCGVSVYQSWKHSPMPNVFCLEDDAELLHWLAAQFEERAREVEARNADAPR